MSDKINKELEALEKYFKETPREEIQKIIDEVDKMEFEGPTVEEYFGNFESAFVNNCTNNINKMENRETENKLSLGDRMKTFYENIHRISLTRRTYTIIRIDGKAFHTYTRHLEKPFDLKLVNDMMETTKFLCSEIQGCKLGYTQSDEISLVLTDFDNINTQAWFDGNLQKICSVSASLATAYFNRIRPIGKLATFDSRVFQIPTKNEVINYLIFRQQDATRNSIQSVAQSIFTEKEMFKKNGNELQEMLFQKGINWNDYPTNLKRGSLIVKNEEGMFYPSECPIFTQDKSLLESIIPTNQ